VTTATLNHLGDGRFAVNGNMDFGSAAELLAQGKRDFPARGRIDLDLSGVTRANSAGLALLLEWMDTLQANGAELRLRNLPGALADIARMSNVYQLLPVDET
jgi:phospholipid transport system transporter-binding protein